MTTMLKMDLLALLPIAMHLLDNVAMIVQTVLQLCMHR